MLKRYLTKEISEDRRDKMVFRGGPRQVGKTTFAQKIIGVPYRNPAYYHWDFKPDCRDILKVVGPGETDLIIFDEIHICRKENPITEEGTKALSLGLVGNRSPSQTV